MKIEITINNKKVVEIEATWSNNSKTGESFHDLARIAHHALDKAMQELQTAKAVVK